MLVGGLEWPTTVPGAASCDGTTWTALSSTPSLRDSSQMVFDSTRGKLLLFGGYNAGTYLNDLWEY